MKVHIGYSDGQYFVGSCEQGEDYEGWETTCEMDSRDFEAYLAFQKVAVGWNAFIRDLDSKAHRGTVFGPWPRK
jgi:hypothetical protein